MALQSTKSSDTGAFEEGVTLAYVHVEIRLASPMQGLFDAYLNRHPTDKSYVDYYTNQSLMDKMRKGNIIEPVSAPKKPAVASYNEIEIRVICAQAIPNRGGAESDESKGESNLPNAYVYYQFLGFQETFTNIVESTNPQFDHVASFPVLMHQSLTSFLQKHSLKMILMDDTGDGKGRVLGMINIEFNEFLAGHSIREFFPLHTYIANSDTGGRKIGNAQIQVEISWKYPIEASSDELSTKEV